MELPDGRCFELAQQLREFKQATEEEWFLRSLFHIKYRLFHSI